MIPLHLQRYSVTNIYVLNVTGYDSCDTYLSGGPNLAERPMSNFGIFVNNK